MNKFINILVKIVLFGLLCGLIWWVACASTNQRVLLTWTATGDDGSVGKAIKYDVRYSTDSVQLINWINATKLNISNAPKMSGEKESCYVHMPKGKKQYIAIKVQDEMGNLSDISNLGIFDKNLTVTMTSLPPMILMEQNYPNPFGVHGTTLSFQIEKGCMLDIDIVNVYGQRVKHLVTEQFTPGFYTVEWDCSDQTGGKVASGVYFAHFTCDGAIIIKKMLHIK